MASLAPVILSSKRACEGLPVMDMVGQITSALEKHSSIRQVRLVGSRERQEATALSDWDFRVETDDFDDAAQAIALLVQPLKPLAQQWDRLSRRKNYMLIFRGPIKVDLLFEQPNDPEGPWRVSRSTIRGIDDHFWDWILWIAAKYSAGNLDLARNELGKMFAHLLRPIGVTRVPGNVEEAISLYKTARLECENRFQVTLPNDLEHEIERALRQSGFRA
jgi:predicted nucleotidyltransferase